MYTNYDFEGSKISRPTVSVISSISTWRNYDIDKIGGIYFVRGHNKEPKEICRRKEFKNNNVLLDMLDLYSKLSDSLKTTNQIRCNNNLTEEDMLLVLNFCKKHGLPFWHYDSVNPLTINPCANVFLPDTDARLKNDGPESITHDIIPLSDHNIFPISSFITTLFFLHSDFLKVIAFHDIDISHDEHDESIVWTDDDLIQGLLQERDLLKVEKYKEHEILHLYTPHLQPFKTYWNDLSGLGMETNNQFHLAVYYLCLLQKSWNSSYVRTCRGCGSLFTTENPRRQYCGHPCTRQNIFNRKKRNQNNLDNTKRARVDS